MTWDKISNKYDRIFNSYEDVRELSITKVVPLLSKDDKVLELACGTGNLSLGIAKKLNKLVATDLSGGMLDVAKEKAVRVGISNIEFKKIDAEKTGFPDNSFDKVIIFNAIHIMENPIKVLSEINRLLKTNGMLITASECYGEPVKYKMRLGLNILKVLSLFKLVSSFSFYNMKDIDTLLKTSGFKITSREILKKEPVKYFNTAIKVEKVIV